MSEVFARFGLMTLSRLPRPRPATDGDFVPMVGAETEAGIGEASDGLVWDSTAVAEMLALRGSGLLCTFVTGRIAGDVRGVLATTGSLLVVGRGGSMLSFGT